MSDLRKVLTKHVDLLGKITDLFDKDNVPANEGEMVLAWIIGISVGMRGGSLTEKGGPADVIAIAWKLGAEEGL